MKKKIITGILVAALVATLVVAAYTEQEAFAKHFRAKLFGSVLKLSNANLPVTISLIDGYYNGEKVYFIHTEVSDKQMADMLTMMVDSPTTYTPLLAKTPKEVLAKLYVFANGIEGTGKWGGGPFGFQIDIFNSIPGESEYSPLREPHLVTWNEDATPRLLTSEEELLEAEANGELTIKPTGVVVNVPMIVWPGDYLNGQMPIREDKEVTDEMPYGGGQVLEIHTENLEVTFVAHRGWGPDGATVYYIVTDAVPEGPAKMMGVVYAPKTEALAISPVAVDLFQFANGIQGSGPMGFQAGIAASAPGDENYSPMWRISMINWNEPRDAKVLENMDDIKMAKEKIKVEPAFDGKHIVNCPFITVT